MSNAYITGFRTIHHKAASPFPSCKLHGNGIFRTFSTCTSPLNSSTPPLSIRSPSSLVLASSQIVPSNLPQRSEEWFALRRDKLTTSTFSTALGFWKGNRRHELWHEKVFASDVQSIEASRNSAMEWGMLNEAAAIEQYKSITGRDVSLLGFAIHSEEQFNWLGASPDGLLGCFPGGCILEVKVQGQMEIMGREWVDLYCWTPNGSTIFHVCRDRSYWELIHGILREFWWESVVPAREALLLGKEEEARLYKPASTHKQTGLEIEPSKAGHSSINPMAKSEYLKPRAVQFLISHRIDASKIGEMDSGGLSWADQWDYNTPDPPPPSAEDGKKEDGSSKGGSGKKKLNFKWMKVLVKKSNK
ncbi:hypothetical protein CK203_028594 [Vitis vinifera]|uniref:YqaJ viral recombinase domain-containing protein n=1 Tax=Vitis vinifera TaxID=29760 RepID=A0A438I2I1_VITVI|nr:hypothetical protein CK203_028594 [Vitis vinifera]